MKFSSWPMAVAVALGCTACGGSVAGDYDAVVAITLEPKDGAKKFTNEKHPVHVHVTNDAVAITGAPFEHCEATVSEKSSRGLILAIGADGCTVQLGGASASFPKGSGLAGLRADKLWVEYNPQVEGTTWKGASISIQEAPRTGSAAAKAEAAKDASP